MSRRVTMAAVVLLALAGVGAYAWRAVHVAQGLAVGVAPRAAPAVPPGEVRWLKGQTHAHTNNSGDSHTPPEQAARWYARHGFDFVVFTDHNFVTQLPPVDGMLVLPGMEITQNLKTCTPPPPAGKVCLLHVNALFIDPKKVTQLTKVDTDEREALYGRAVDAAKAMGALPQVNHPNFMYGADTALLEKLDARGAHWFELANTQPDANNAGDATHPSTEKMWDDALTAGAHLYGTCTDDAHHYDDAAEVRARGETVYDGDHGFIMVRARKAPADIRDAVARGDFYATTGPTLAALEVGDGGISLELSGPGEGEVRFIGPGGEVVHRAHAHAAALELGGRRYLRAEVQTDDGGTVWTQPLWAR